MELFGYFGALCIGLILGLTGGGGSILTVPILVYVMLIDPMIATAYSLFIVGTTSAFGAFSSLSVLESPTKSLTGFLVPTAL